MQAPAAASRNWAEEMLSEEAWQAGIECADSAARGPPSDHCQLGPAPTLPLQPHLVQWWARQGGFGGPQSQGSRGGARRRGRGPLVWKCLSSALELWRSPEIGEVRSEPFGRTNGEVRGKGRNPPFSRTQGNSVALATSHSAFPPSSLGLPPACSPGNWKYQH